MMLHAVKTHFSTLQHHLCQVFEGIDHSSTFRSDDWQHHAGGGGKSTVLENGAVFEKAGIHFSAITGQSLPETAQHARPELAETPFEATGISLVIHPNNPYVPTTHMNLRYFIAKTASPVWWFGGGFDLTPYYGFEEDCRHWHQMAKQACDRLGPSMYSQYKAWCDRYFFLPHRQEARGIGGIFFDDLNQWPFEVCFDFIRAVGAQFEAAYCPIVKRRHAIPFGDRETQFQRYRRGRYVEFNLLYDRGTRFGLQSGGRAESILSSLPQHAEWRYDFHPEPGSPEAALYTDFLRVRDWV